MVHVDDIANFLERVEGNPDRQKDVEVRQIERDAKIGQSSAGARVNKIEILEGKKDAEQNRQTNPKDQLLLLRILRLIDPKRRDVGDRGRNDHQNGVLRLPAHVKVVAGDQ